MAGSKLPTPTADTLDALRRVGRYLDHVADISLNDHAHTIARTHACEVWRAIERVEALAEIVEDLSDLFGDQIDRGYLRMMHDLRPRGK